METQIAQPNYRFEGEIFAALVFQLSSISIDTKVRHDVQTGFEKNSVVSLPAATFARLSGLTD